MRILDADALVLHVRAYRETSVIARFFTADHGLVSVIAKGVKGAGGTRKRRSDRMAELQPFNRVRLSWVGGRGLLTLTSIEMAQRRSLHGEYLAGGFYVLELLSRLMHEHDAHPRLYHTTQAIIDAIEAGGRLSTVLRQFERALMNELGFGLDFASDLEGEPLREGEVYRLVDGEGFLADPGGAWRGDLLLGIGASQFDSGEVRRAARLLFRELLEPHLGDRPLMSRSLLQDGSSTGVQG